MMVSKKKFISGCILVLVLLIIVFSIFSEVVSTNVNMTTVIGFVLIGIISLYNAIIDDRMISTNKFYWYFQFVFMSIAPLCQYLSRYFPWGVHIDESDIEMGVYLVILWNIIYAIVYHNKTRHIKRGVISNSINSFFVSDREYSYAFLVIVFCVAVAGFALLVKMIGFYNLFFRSENSLDIENSTINFVVRKFLTALPAMAAAIFILKNKKNKSTILELGIFILVVFSVCANFPTSTTRYWMGTIFIGIAFVTVVKRKSSRIVDYGIIFGLLVAFPLFYMFKTMTITDLFAGNVQFSGVLNSFNTVDFDAFTLVARSVRYVRENGITWGQQLWNIILFFVPRSIWADKPITTNVLIATNQNQNFTNLSCPLPAEGYVNFGIIGLLLYCIVYAKINKFLDNMYWKSCKPDELSFLNVIYPFLCVITLYINRGPLQPSFIQTIALMLPLIFLNLFTKRKRNRGIDNER